MKIKDGFGDVILIMPESTPSCGDSGTKNGDRPRPGVLRQRLEW